MLIYTNILKQTRKNKEKNIGSKMVNKKNYKTKKI